MLWLASSRLVLIAASCKWKFLLGNAIVSISWVFSKTKNDSVIPANQCKNQRSLLRTCYLWPSLLNSLALFQGPKESAQFFSHKSFREPFGVMDVRTKKCVFLLLVTGRNFLAPWASGIRVRNVCGKSGQKTALSRFAAYILAKRFQISPVLQSKMAQKNGLRNVPKMHFLLPLFLLRFPPKKVVSARRSRQQIGLKAKTAYVYVVFLPWI